MPNSTSATRAAPDIGWGNQLGSPWSRQAHVGRLEPPGRPLVGPVKTATLPFWGRFWPAGGWRRLRASRRARARRRAAPAAPAAASWSLPGLGSSRAQPAAGASLCAGAAAACFRPAVPRIRDAATRSAVDGGGPTHSATGGQRGRPRSISRRMAGSAGRAAVSAQLH